MREGDNITLALLASSISTTTKDAAKSTQDQIRAQQTKDPTARIALSSLENIQVDLNCFTEACDFLSSQLRDARSIEDVVAEEGSELFWRSVCLMLEAWQRGIEGSLTRLKGERPKLGWKEKLAERFNEDFAFVKRNTDAHMDEAQMTIALLNLNAELRHRSTPEHDRLCFLSKDLGWKVAKAQNRISRDRSGKPLDSDQIEFQSVIVKITKGMVAKAKQQMDASPGYSETGPEPQGATGIEKGS